MICSAYEPMVTLHETNQHTSYTFGCFAGLRELQAKVFDLLWFF